MAPDLRAVALAASRVEGCTCEPVITTIEVAPHVHRAEVAHDDWCPLLRSRLSRSN